MVLYNEFNPDEEAIGAVSAADLRSRPDAVIVVGTSLKVPGIRRLAKEMCAVTRGRRGGFTAWINRDPEPVGIDFKDSWDFVVRGECDEVAHRVGLPPWDDKDIKCILSISDEDKAKKGLLIESNPVLKPRQLDVVKIQVPTPGASPRPSSPASLVSVVIQSKQSQISFGTKPVAQKEPKAKKTPARKPKPAEPKNKITSAFTTSKASKSTAAKQEKSDLYPNHLFPNLSIETSAMRHVSPTDHRTNSDVYSHKKEDSTDFVKGSIPSTPTQESTHFDRHETISPKGRVPSGMENLIS
jgi:NAD-dependent histone deacetylase SIR2